MTTHTLKYGDFLVAYKQAKNRDQEIVAFMNAFQQIELQQENRIAQSKTELLKEIRLEDLATKVDISSLENKMLQQELRLVKEISASKWQVIGAVAAMLFIEIALKHFGF